MIIGDRLGILDIVVMLALLTISLWKGGWVRGLLSICLVIWGVYAIPYDVKVAAPVLTIGFILFLMTFLQLRKGTQDKT